MKILHILNSDFGNPATMGYRSFKIVEKSPFNINVYCRSNMSEAYSQQVHVPFNFLRTFGRFTQLVLKLTGQSRLYSILREIELYLFNSKATLQIKKSSIVHFFYHDEKLIDYAKSLGKIVVVEGFSHPNFLKRMRSEGVVFDSSNIHSDDHSIPCYEKANMIISPSAWVSKTLTYAGIPESKIELINYGVHLQSRKTYCDSKPLKIIFAGGLKRTKGVIELIEAVNYFTSDEVELNIYGRMHASLENQVKRMVKNKKNIKINSFTDDIVEKYKESDIYVYPTYFEGSSKTVFEAMSCGLPVITTEHAGSIIRDNKDGYLVPICDSVTIKEKIQLFINDPLLIDKLGKSAQKHSSNYTWELYSKKVNDFYKGVNIETKIYR